MSDAAAQGRLLPDKNRHLHIFSFPTPCQHTINHAQAPQLTMTPPSTLSSHISMLYANESTSSFVEC